MDLTVGYRVVRLTELMAYEFGYRQQTSEFFFWDLAAFYNRYEKLHDLRMITPPAALPSPRSLSLHWPRAK